MNVLRSIARDFFNRVAAENLTRPEVGVSGLNGVRQQRVAAVVDATRYRDSFEQLPQGSRGVRQTLGAERRSFHSALSAARTDSFMRDGFEAAHRAPVDLSGGVKPAVHVEEQAAPRPTLPSNGFMAALDDL